MKELSKMATSIKPSLTRLLFNLAKKYDDVIDFTLGDPDVQPHLNIKEAGCKAIMDGKTRYSQNAGLLELRQVVSEYYIRKEGFAYDPLTEIMISVGAMEGLYLALLSILNPGDEVIIPAPYYINYAQMATMCGAVPVIIDKPTKEPLTFDVEDIESVITDKTKVIIINTPANPSGKIISWDKIHKIASIAKQHDLYVISDEVYKCLIYGDTVFQSIVSIDGMRERTVLINSLSKEFCMTGWRIGYVLAPPEIISVMTKLQENIAACAPLPSQYAAIEALRSGGDYSANMKSVFSQRRDIIVSGINAISGLSCTPPDATFYLMVDISRTGLKSYDFAVELLEAVHVAVVPGVTYGESCDKYIRMAFTLEIDKIKQGIERIAKFMERFNNKRKKVLMLGGSLYQTYAIKEAVRLGYYVISCDYMPNNPGHKYSHEYHNVSTTDKEAVLELAQKLNVDGVVVYASDPAAPTAAYVCEKLGLPTSPYKSVEILSNKDLFRDFLQKHGFNCPKAMGFSKYEDALAHIDEFQMPVMVKPVDSSGSKGINKMTDKSQLKDFVEEALRYSRSKRFLIEEFIAKKGYQISGDAFSVDGKLVFHCLGNEFYDAKCDKDFAPLGECWPFQMDHKYITDLEGQLQRLITLLNMKSNAYNVEAIVGTDDKVYILELGARSGGSLIPQVTEYATGVNMVTYVIKAAMGEDCSELKQVEPKGCWSNYMVHSNATGKFKNIEFDASFRQKYLVDWVTDIKEGDSVHKFRDAQDCIGELILKYDNMEEMFEVIAQMERFINVIVE